MGLTVKGAGDEGRLVGGAVMLVVMVEAGVLEGAATGVEGVWVDRCAIPDDMLGHIEEVIAQVLRRLIERVTVDALLLEYLIQDLAVSRVQQPLLPVVRVRALRVI